MGPGMDPLPPDLKIARVGTEVEVEIRNPGFVLDVTRPHNPDIFEFVSKETVEDQGGKGKGGKPITKTVFKFRAAGVGIARLSFCCKLPLGGKGGKGGRGDSGEDRFLFRVEEYAVYDPEYDEAAALNALAIPPWSIQDEEWQVLELKPRLKHTQSTAVCVEWDAVDNTENYVLCLGPPEEADPHQMKAVHLIEQAKSSFSGDFKPPEKDEPKTLSMVIDGLQPSTTYKVCVKVQSLPSDADPPEVVVSVSEALLFATNAPPTPTLLSPGGSVTCGTAFFIKCCTPSEAWVTVPVMSTDTISEVQTKVGAALQEEGDSTSVQSIWACGSTLDAEDTLQGLGLDASVILVVNGEECIMPEEEEAAEVEEAAEEC